LLLIGNHAGTRSDCLIFGESDNKILAFNANVGIGTTSPSYKIDVAGGAYCNGTNWVNSSDRNMKENFEVIDGRKILGLIEDLPVMKWNYKSDAPSIKHIGPVAQEFYSLFGLGNDDKSISSIDPSGVALVAIKELSSQNKAMREQIEVQQKQIDELKGLVTTLIANQTIQGNK
jgi:hypothetical protein